MVLRCLSVESCDTCASFAGRLLDVTENPNVPYGLFAAWQMIGGVLVAIVVPLLKRYTDQSAAPDQERDTERGDNEGTKEDLLSPESQPMTKLNRGQEE